jgi:hypothetical protein
MATAVARFKKDQSRLHAPTDFDKHLTSARDQMLENRVQRQKTAAAGQTGTAAKSNAFDPDRPLGGARDDYAHPKVTPPSATAPRRTAGSRPAVAPRVTRPSSMRSTDFASYPRPAHDNGRGLHWIPTTGSSPEAVDRFVDEAKSMHASWVVFLNEGADVGKNDYLVKKLTDAGIEPVMRIYTPGVGPVGGDVESMVRHYKELGVHYYQVLNEPNLRDENGGQTPNVDRYLDSWIPTARKVIAGGGLPGFGALSPAGDVDDVQFLRDALDGLKARNALDTLDHGWLAAHNYTLGRPIDDQGGFMKFRWYDEVVRAKLGRSVPIIGTEGGTTTGSRDTDVSAMKYMETAHEPYFFTNTLWVIANKAGGGHDPQWEKHALIRDDGTSPVVDALRTIA